MTSKVGRKSAALKVASTEMFHYTLQFSIKDFLSKCDQIRQAGMDEKKNKVSKECSRSMYLQK